MERLLGDEREPVIVQVEQKPDYRDLDRELDDILQASGSLDIPALIEKHQIRVTPQQRQALLYLMGGTVRMRAYALNWLDLAGREGNARDFIEYQKAQTLSIPEENRNLTFAPVK